MSDKKVAAIQQALGFLEAGDFVYPTQLANNLRAALDEPEPPAEYVVRSNGRPSPVLTAMMNARRRAEEQQKTEPEPSCWCHKCNEGRTVNGIPFTLNHMILCPTCGNKRCPHASDHRLDCTNSNAPGQPGSVYSVRAEPKAEPEPEPMKATMDTYLEELLEMTDEQVLEGKDSATVQAAGLRLLEAAKASIRAEPEPVGMGAAYSQGAFVAASKIALAQKTEPEPVPGPVAWMHPDGRVIPASTMDGAKRDGGAMLSSVAGYTIPLGRMDAPPSRRSLTPAQEAAPELLEAAKEMLQLLESIRNLNGPPIDKARAAIAKAEGQQ